MALVKKGNVELTIDDTAVGSYLCKGFDEIDSKGKVVKEATAGKTISVEQYRNSMDTLKAQIAKLSKKADKAE